LVENTEIFDLKKSLDELKNNVKEREDNIVSLNRQISRLQEENKSLKDKMAEDEMKSFDQIGSRDTEIKNLKSQNSEKSKELSKNSDSLNISKITIEKLEADNIFLKQTISSVQKEKEGLLLHLSKNSYEFEVSLSFCSFVVLLLLHLS
jgi:prefoldin subunit 5